jgi:polar amino acid transport system substrate-binding protein
MKAIRRWDISREYIPVRSPAFWDHLPVRAGHDANINFVRKEMFLMINYKNLSRRSKSSLTACGALLLAAIASSPAAATPIRLVTESYPPYNYTDNGKLTGLSVELMHKVMEGTKLSYDMELMPWARAISLAENEDGHCVFTTVHNEERDKRFQWVEPLLTSQAYLIKTIGSDIHAKTIDEARQYLVGTQRSDYTVDLLKSKQFERIDLASEIDVTLNKLLLGRIDLMAMSGQLVNELIEKGTPIEPVLVLEENLNGVACNKSIPRETIAIMQESLNRLIADGTRAAIFKKYNFKEGMQ